MRTGSALSLLTVVLLAGCAATSGSPAVSTTRVPSPGASDAGVVSTSNDPGASLDPTPGSLDVRTYRGSDTRTGVMPGPGPQGKPVIRWTFDAGAPIGSQVAVVDGVVYLVSTDGVVHALDVDTGDERWKASTGAETYASPSVVDGLVLIGANDGSHAFAVADGSQAWFAPATGEVHGCPAVAGHTAVFASHGGTATALDTRTGTVLWSHSLGAADDSSIAADDGVAVFGLQDGVVVALAIADGTERWRTDTGDGARIGTLSIAEGRVFVPTLDGGSAGSRHVSTLDLATGNLLWRFASPGDQPAYAPAIADGRAIVQGEDGSVTALDVATGAVLWQSKAPGRVEIVAAVADGVSYGASNGGVAFAIDATTGAERWQIPIQGVPYGAAVTSGLVLIGTSTGILYAIGGTVP